MKRHRVFLTICTMLAGAAAAIGQEPAPQPPIPPAPPAVPAPPVPPLLWDDTDEGRAKMEALRHREVLRDWQIDIDKEAMRETARMSAEIAREMAQSKAMGGF